MSLLDLGWRIKYQELVLAAAVPAGDHMSACFYTFSIAALESRHRECKGGHEKVMGCVGASI